MLQKRQEWLTNYLKDNNYEQLDFVNKFNGKAGIDNIVNDIRNTLGLKENWAGEFPNWEKAKDFFTQKIEDIGIITLFNSVVCNDTHRKIKVDDCRGLVLVNDYAPFMFINNADSKSAQIFTLAHELAHIWLGKRAGFDFRQLQPANNPGEILCDKIAAEFLVPQNAINSEPGTNQNIEYLAKQFKVSQLVIARRLLDLGKIKRDEFFSFYNEYIKKDYQKKKEKEGGGDFYKTQRKRLGIRYINFINQAVSENKLLIRDAYQLTNLKGDTYHKFIKEHLS